MSCNCKFVGTLIFYICGTAAFCASAGTGISIYASGNSNIHTGYFQRCTVVGSDIACIDMEQSLVGTCQQTWDMIQAGRAFTILASIFSGVTTIAAIVRCASPALLAGKVAFLALIIATVIFGVIDFALGFSLMTEKLCDQTPAIEGNNIVIGPSAPLAVIGTIFFLIALIMEAAMDGPAGAAAAGASSSSSAENKQEEAGNVENKKEENNNETPQPKDDSADRQKKEQQEEEDKKKKQQQEEEENKKKQAAAAQEEENKKKQAAAAEEEKKKQAAAAEEEQKKKAAAEEEQKKKQQQAAEEEQKKKAAEEKAAADKAAAEKNKKPEINWKEINAKLPYDKKSEEQKKRRFAMFDKIDTNKTGKISLSEMTAGMESVLGLGKEIDVPIVIRTAFDKARVAGQQAGANDASGGDFIEKNEFRLFLMYVRMYFEMYQLFSQLDETGDMMIEIAEFQKSIPLLKTWGAKIDDVSATFKQIDKNGGGKVLFGEFVDWALSPEQNLDCPDDDE